MARPATGSPKWSEERQRWEARVTLDGGMRKLVPLPTSIRKEDSDTARRVAQIISDKSRRDGKVPETTAKTVNEWVVDWLAARTRAGLATVAHDQGRLKNHVQPVIGTRPIADVTREDVERVVADLDRKVRLADEHPDHLVEDREQRVGGGDEDVRRRRERQGARAPRARRQPGDRRARPRPRRRSLEGLPVPERVPAPAALRGHPWRFRALYAVAVYTFARAGELEALTWNDVDLEHGVIHINKAVDRRRPA